MLTALQYPEQTPPCRVGQRLEVHRHRMLLGNGGKHRFGNGKKQREHRTLLFFDLRGLSTDASHTHNERKSCWHWIALLKKICMRGRSKELRPQRNGESPNARPKSSTSKAESNRIS